MSVPAYPAYRDSGVEWLGDVPAHWGVGALKRPFAIIGGTTPKADNPEFWDGGIPWATPTDLGSSGSFTIFETSRTISEAGLASCGTTMVPAGSVILSTRAPIGSLGIAGVPLCTNQGCKSLVPLGDDCPSFFAHLLSVSTAELNIRGSGSTFLELSGDKLGAFQVPVPPPAEQAAIAAFLDRETGKIDALVEEQRRLIALLKEKRQAVISHAVTKGLNPHAPLKPSGIEWLGDIPAHWEVRPLRFLVELKSGGTPSKDRRDFWDGSIPWASAKDLKSEKLADTIDHITDLAVHEGAASINPAGVVLVLVRGMMLARAFPIVKTAVPMAINQDLKAVSPGREMDVDYLAWALRASGRESMDRCDEAGHGTKALRMEAWLSMRLPVPDRHEQQQIARRLVDMAGRLDALMAEAELGTTLLQERRAALISAAVTGKIDVRGLVAAPGALEAA